MRDGPRGDLRGHARKQHTPRSPHSTGRSLDVRRPNRPGGGERPPAECSATGKGGLSDSEMPLPCDGRNQSPERPRNFPDDAQSGTAERGPPAQSGHLRSPCFPPYLLPGSTPGRRPSGASGTHLFELLGNGLIPHISQLQTAVRGAASPFSRGSCRCVWQPQPPLLPDTLPVSSFNGRSAR